MFDHFVVALIVSVYFVIIFYGADMLAQKDVSKHEIFFYWELYIPFFNIAFIPYFGIFMLPFFIPFTIKKKNNLYLLLLRLIIAISVAGIIFLLIPCNLGYPQRSISPQFETFIQMVAGSHNLIPSLHVSLTIIICYSIFPTVSKIIQLLIVIIVIILPLSTLLTHQHHIVDVIAGIMLAMFVNIFIRNN
jgi:membrane-associated phospholipid phosphatase